MHPMIIFDDGLGQLGPMADLRASFEVRTGMLTTSRRIAAARPKTLTGYWVPQRLAALVAERANAPVNALPNDEILFCVNGRWAMPDGSLELGLGEALVEADSGHVVAALLRRAEAEYFLNTGHLHERIIEQRSPVRHLFRFPWDVLAMSKGLIAQDILAARPAPADALDASQAATAFGGHPIKIHPTARICPNVTIDAEGGPVMVQERAVIRPGVILCGPCSIGEDSTVLDRTLIKANTVIGPHCKVAGEIGATIFQGFANKAHDGHLGDSWVGRWVNFGAGTTNSNLLNTYGEVVMRMDPDGPRHRTGMQFLGAIVGDHAKFAICTRLMTGSVIGTGAMIATTAAALTTVPRFAWMTDEGTRTFRLDKFLEIARTVMARRKVQMSEAAAEAVRELHGRATAVART